MRGVNIDGVLQTLMERGLVKIAGRAEIPWPAATFYETTQFFLDHFGLRNLDELPNAEELRRRDLPKAHVVAAIVKPASQGFAPGNRKFWVAHASGVLVSASRRNNASTVSIPQRVGRTRKVRDREDAITSTPEACATQTLRSRAAVVS